MQLAPVTFAPSTCLLCSRAPQEGEFFVDTQVKIQRGPVRDRVYVCPECGGQIADALSWVDPKHYESALSELGAAHEARQNLEDEKAAREADVLAWAKNVAEVYAPKAPAQRPVRQTRRSAVEPDSE